MPVDQISIGQMSDDGSVSETKVRPGNTYRRGSLSTVDLLIKESCFAKHKDCNIKSICSKLASPGRSTVLSLPF